MGPLTAPTFRSKSCGATWPNSPTSGTWPLRPTRSLRLNRRAHFLGGLGQVVFVLRLFRQLPGLGAQQSGQLLVAVVVEHMRLPVSKHGCVRRLNARDLEDRVALAGGRKLRRVALLGAEGLRQKLLAAGQRGNHARLLHRLRGHHLKMMRRRRFFQAILDRLGCEVLRVLLLRLRWASRMSVAWIVGSTSLRACVCAVCRSSTCTMW